MPRSWIENVISSPPWLQMQVEDAARGLVNGSCLDSREVQLKFWIELARDELGGGTPEFLARVENLKQQALRGEFE